MLALAPGCSGGSEPVGGPSATADAGTPVPSPASTQQAERPSATPRAGNPNDLPPRDLVDLARRFGRITPNATPDLPPATPPALGSSRDFDIVLMPGSPSQPPVIERRHATLRAISDHAYFYWTDDVSIGDDQAQEAARQFENEVYAQISRDFGAPPLTGASSDSRFAVVHTDLGGGASGYFAGADRYSRTVSPHSNETNAVYLDSSLEPGTAAYREVVAHEFAHLLQDGNNRRQQVWLDEGMSVVASQVVGSSNGFRQAFEQQPQTQLNAWSVDDSAPHYAAAGLFLSYLLGRYGGPAAAADLERQAAVGEDAIDAFLAQRSAGKTFEDIFADWVVANIAGRRTGDFAYALGEGPALSPERLTAGAEAAGTLPQFAAAYYEIEGPAAATVHFDGAPSIPALPAQPHAGSGMWWSNRGDSADTRLTREVDLTGVSAATLRFWTWYDIEEWYDYGYVAVSTDGGRTWTPLAGRRTTTENPVGEAYGPGYTGISGGGSAPTWVEEQVNLTPFAGKPVLLRFELVTDYAYNRPGWAIDDISIPEIGWSDGAEAAGDWQAEGFQRIDAPLPQRFIIRLVEFNPAFRVTDIPLDSSNQADVLVQPALGRPPVIVVAPVTRGTTEPATYRLRLTASP